MRPLGAIAADLRSGATTSEQLVETCLRQIEDPDGEGSRVFVAVDAEGSLAAGRAMDQLRRVGAEPSPWAGIPVSVKDLFDMRGQVTRAGSRALDGSPADRDAIAVARLRAAGFVVIGRTNMTEFAFSGLGVNPHHGTPLNPWSRSDQRIPGGSTSGGAVSVTDEMAYGALGTDTGGSCRIPAALCGLVGFKPTQDRIPRDGAVPLSTTLDTVGVLGATVECIAILDALLCGSTPEPLTRLPRPPRLVVPRNYLFDEIDESVAADFSRLVDRIRDAGAHVEETTFPELDTIPDLNSGGGFPAAEAWSWHHDLLAAHGDLYDPRVRSRIERGAHQTARDLITLTGRRQALIADVGRRLDAYDGLLCPTVPLVAPPLSAFDSDGDYSRINLLMLRNSTVINLIDGCAISIPAHTAGRAPTGAMIAGPHGTDTTVLRIAAWIKEHS
jgi:aspartyl-tRNA(Asn)/glutamyl-tRNA(Gln) amidotransferase subunit A